MPWRSWSATYAGGTACAKHSTGYATSSAWRVVPRSGARPRASWGHCGIPSCVCPTFARRSTAWKRGGGHRCSRKPRTASISSRTWATSSPGRWWSARRPRRPTATRSGAERFVTPELKAYEAKVLGAEEGIAAREAQLVDALRIRVAEAIARVQTTAGVLARLDVWGALSDVAHREGYVRPEVNDGFTIMLEGSRHPVVERMMARGLVLLDEIGRGTSTYDGVAIAWAVTEFLHNTVGCKTIFATHYHELTQLTEELAHARNFNVAVREAGDEIVFLHRLEPGGTDRSYGIHVGRLAGLPAPVVGRAWQVLALLEAGHHVAHQAPPAPPDAAQLGLFNPLGSPHPLLEELDRLDVNTLSPLDALNRLAAWKKQLAEGP